MYQTRFVHGNASKQNKPTNKTRDPLQINFTTGKRTNFSIYIHAEHFRLATQFQKRWLISTNTHTHTQLRHTRTKAKQNGLDDWLYAPVRNDRRRHEEHNQLLRLQQLILAQLPQRRGTTGPHQLLHVRRPLLPLHTPAKSPPAVAHAPPAEPTNDLLESELCVQWHAGRSSGADEQRAQPIGRECFKWHGRYVK